MPSIDTLVCVGLLVIGAVAIMALSVGGAGGLTAIGGITGWLARGQLANRINAPGAIVNTGNAP